MLLQSAGGVAIVSYSAQFFTTSSAFVANAAVEVQTSVLHAGPRSATLARTPTAMLLQGGVVFVDLSSTFSARYASFTKNTAARSVQNSVSSRLRDHAFDRPPLGLLFPTRNIDSPPIGLPLDSTFLTI